MMAAPSCYTERPYRFDGHRGGALERKHATLSGRLHALDGARRRRRPQAIACDDEGRREHVDRLLERDALSGADKGLVTRAVLGPSPIESGLDGACGRDRARSES